eukprot:8766616-Alexandrium_andersonii.AAC.1
MGTQEVVTQRAELDTNNLSEEWRLARFASLKRELQEADETPGGPPPAHLSEDIRERVETAWEQKCSTGR